jgi:hypothetical protein
MSLSKKQQDFTLAIAQLINYAYARGYLLTFGDAYRDPRVHGEIGQRNSYSSSKSCHKYRLAVDFNLFANGNYIADGTHFAYIDIGEEWERIHPLARWGGRFGDANHFSFEHNSSK